MLTQHAVMISQAFRHPAVCAIKLEHRSSPLEWDKPLGLTMCTAIGTASFVSVAPNRCFFVALRWYINMMFVLFLLSASINIFVANDFFSECLESMHFVVTGVHLFSKYLTMQRREKDFLKLFSHIQTVWEKYKLHHHTFLAKTLSSANKATILTFIFIGSVPLVNILAAMLKNALDPQTLHFPIQIWVPAIVKQSFWIGSFAQVMMFYPLILCICMTTSFLNSISIHVEALGLSLAQEIKRLNTESWSKSTAKELYQKHQEVIGIVLTVNDLMAANWGFEMLCSSLQLTLPAYRTLRALKQNDVEVFNHAFILLLNFMVIYLIFASGNRILSMGDEIHASVWESKWYETGLDERKNFQFMLFRGTLPVEYKYKIITFDLPGFTKVVNTVFSYMALLRFLDNMEE